MLKDLEHGQDDYDDYAQDGGDKDTEGKEEIDKEENAKEDNE